MSGHVLSNLDMKAKLHRVAASKYDGFVVLECGGGGYY